MPAKLKVRTVERARGSKARNWLTQAHYATSLSPQTPKYFDARTDSVADVVAAIKDDGACVVTNLIAPEVADSILAEMRPFMDRTSKGRDNFSGLQTVRGEFGSKVAEN
jgi:hypothetical protein